MYGMKLNTKSVFPVEVEQQMPYEQVIYYPTWFNTMKQQMKEYEQVEKIEKLEKLVQLERMQQELKGEKKFLRNTLEDIVISGVSGRFAMSENVEELAQLLLKEKELEQQMCWELKTQQEKYWKVPAGLYETKYMTEVESIVEPTIKKLLEVTYECLVDAGMNPVELKCVRTGVFLGVHKKQWEEELMIKKSILAERLAHFYEFKGPIVTVEEEQATSLVAMDKAINAIKLGLCEFAIVGGVKMGQTCGVVLLQKKSTMPRRFYAKVVHSKVIEEPIMMNTTTGLYEKEQWINEKIQSRLLKEIYGECGVEPSTIGYLETIMEQQKEVENVSEIFVNPYTKRQVPLFVGITEKREEETGVLALVKMIISIQRGIIPANLRYQMPVEQQEEESMFKFVNKNTKFFGGLMALNSLIKKEQRVLNVHLLLQPNNEIIMSQEGNESFWNREDLIELSRQPRLFQFSARTQYELEQVLEHMRRNPTELAMHFLLHPQTFTMPSTHRFRGFTVLNGEETIMNKIVEIEEEKKRPIWYVLSGLAGGINQEWKQLAQEMMQLEVFRQTIWRLAEHIKPYGINLVELITMPIYKQQPLNVWYTMVCTTAVQIALIKCLKVAGIKHEGVISHSLGELLCAYVEKALTAEETILTAYHLGKLLHETKLPLYTMAIVKGMTWEEIKYKCPMNIVPIVQCGVENVILSGPKYELIQFVEQLQYYKPCVVVQEITQQQCVYSHLPIHTEMMEVIARQLKTIMEEEILRTPLNRRRMHLRSPKWLSTVFPVEHWEREYVKYFNVDYLVKSLVQPALFHQTFKYVPTNAICIEISPMNILKTILKQEQVELMITKPHAEMCWIPIIKRKYYKNKFAGLKYVEKQLLREQLLQEEIQTGFFEHFQYVLGKLYLKGINVDTVQLYVPYKHEHTIYPVPVNTKFFAHELPLNLVEKIEEEQYFAGRKYFEQEPRLVEKKLIRELLLEKEQPRHIAEKKILRDLIFGEQPRFVEKQLVRELLEVIEPRLVEKKLVRELLYTQEPRHIEKQLLRQVLEQVEPKWVENKIVRELLLQQEPRYVEKQLTRELLQQVAEPRFVLEKEQLLRQPFEKVFLEQEKLMYPFERKEFVELNKYTTTMPVVFHYPIDVTLPVVERELFAHKVEGRHIFPTSGYLHMVWKSMAKLQGMDIEQLPIVFEKVEFHRPTIMTVRGTPVKKCFDFKVKIVPTTGLFEIVEAEKVIVTGRVKVVPTTIKRVFEIELAQRQSFFLPMTSELLRREQIYQELKTKGFETEEELMTLLSTDLKCQYGEMLWTGKWIPFLEGLVQMKTFAKRHTTGIMVPRRIQQLIIDPIAHMQYVEKKLFTKTMTKKSSVLPVFYDRRVKKTVVGGVKLVELKGMFVPRIEKLEREVLFQQQPYFFGQQMPLFFQQQQQQQSMNLINKTLETIVEQEQQQQLPTEFLLPHIKREYIQYYVAECQRLAHYIVKKVLLGEQQQTMTTFGLVESTMTVRPVPQILKQLIEKIKYERKVYQHEPVLTAIVQGGEFLQLLKTIVEEIQLVQQQQQLEEINNTTTMYRQQQENVIRRVKYLLGMRFVQALEKDVILNLVNVKPHFVQLFKNIVEQEVIRQQPWTTTTFTTVGERQQPWTTTVVEQRQQPWTTTVVEQRQQPWTTVLEQGIKMMEVEPRLRLFRSSSEFGLPKYF